MKDEPTSPAVVNGMDSKFEGVWYPKSGNHLKGSEIVVKADGSMTYVGPYNTGEGEAETIPVSSIVKLNDYVY